MSEDADLRLVRTALAEDLAGYGDITSQLTVHADLAGGAVIIAREDWTIPLIYEVGPQIGMPFWAGQKLRYKIVE